MSAKCIGMSFSWEFGQGYYLALRYYNKETKTLEYFYEKEFEDWLLQQVFEILLTKDLIMHNGVYDIALMWSNYGINLIDAFYADTIMMKHRIDEERPFGLKDIAKKVARFIGIPYEELANQEQLDLKQSIRDNEGVINKENLELYKADWKIIGLYACADTDLTLRIFHYFLTILVERNLTRAFFVTEDMPLLKLTTIPMKIGGMPIDIDYFEKLQEKLLGQASELEKIIYEKLETETTVYETSVIDKAINVRRTGEFAIAGMEYFNLPIPVNAKTGTHTLAKPAIEKLSKNYASGYLDWLLWDPKKSLVVEPTLDDCAVLEIKRLAYKKKNKDSAFNVRSPTHLAWLVFNHFKRPIDPSKVSKKTQKPSVDESVLEANKDLTAFPEIMALRKIEKQLSTYIGPILAKNVLGVIYPDLLQFGTTSGRYSGAGGLNMQTLPRDDKSIKAGFIVPFGYKMIAADYSSLEPRIFAAVANDPGLISIFTDRLDFYSKIAIDVYKLEGLSADENSPNYLKKIKPQLRQAVKTFALSVPYGANAYRLAMSSGRPVEEHQKEIDAYLDAYPELKKYMREQERMAYEEGYVQTKFGRIRHLPRAKELFDTYGKDIFNKFKMALKFAGPDGAELYEEYLQVRDELKSPDFDFLEKEEQSSILRAEHKDLLDRSNKLRKKIEKLGEEGILQYGIFRNCMNNAKNSPIQMTAAQVANAAAIKFCALLLEHNLDAWMCLQQHDEIVAIAREDQAEQVAALLKESMENNWVTRRIPVPIIAEPMIGSNLAEVK